MQSPPFPRHIVPPRSKYSPQHLVHVRLVICSNHRKRFTLDRTLLFLLYSQSSLQLLVCRNNWHLSLNYSQMRPLHFFVGYFKLTSFFSRCASPLLCGFVLFVASPRSCVGCYISPVTIVCNIASIDRLVSVLHHCLSCFSPFP